MSSHPQASASSWSRQEFSGLDLGDTRLNDRLVSIADAVAGQPMSPLSAACGDWSAVKAAYRFFDNDKVSPEKVLDPHFQQTVERMRGHERVFAIQDTTYLNYTHHPATQGLGPIPLKVLQIPRVSETHDLRRQCFGGSPWVSDR